MQVLTIRETGPGRAKVSFDGGEWDIEIADPFTDAQEAELAWYFERFLRYPMLEQPRAGAAARSVQEYGNNLYTQVFRDPELIAAYGAYNSDQVRSEIVGSPEFHKLHWEAMWNPKSPKPLALRAAIVRRRPVQGGRGIKIGDAPCLRVLVVVSRPRGRNDVGYRTISRPLVELLRQAKLEIELDFVRPGTWAALKEKLADREQGYYHVLHFDGHGSVTEGNAPAGNLHSYQIGATTGAQARLYFEDGPIASTDFAREVNDARIPVVILNACQSGKETGDPESSLGSRLAQEGVRAVLAMGYSVTVSAARQFIEALYKEVFGGEPLSTGALRGRQSLERDKKRRAYFGQLIELEDWMLPVLYEGDPVRFQFDPRQSEARAISERKINRFDPHPLTYGFWGRDLDVLEVERRILARDDTNVLLIEGMGGTGKTTLLQHLAWWWQTTGLVERVFCFEYDVKPWTRQQMLWDIATKLGENIDPNEERLQQQVAQRLRSERHLLILDNLESVTGEDLAVGQAMSSAAREQLQAFLRTLRGGRTLVLIGSRSLEKWLAAGVFEKNVYALRGLDPEAASSFAERVLRDSGIDLKVQSEPEYKDLVELLEGYPLAMQVILQNLKQHSPAKILKDLGDGGVGLEPSPGKSKTESIVECIDYSHRNLSEDARTLLECFAPFTGVILLGRLSKYLDNLKEEPALSGLPWAKVEAVLGEAERWGLLRREGPFAKLQPVFPYFLRRRLQGDKKAAVERAFRRRYAEYCSGVMALLDSKEPQKRQQGQLLARLEYDNAYRALELSLDARESILAPYCLLSGYLDACQDHQSGLTLAQFVRRRLESYPAAILAGAIGSELVEVLYDSAKRLLLMKKFDDAGHAYLEALQVWRANRSFPDDERRRREGLILHQLGMVAQEQHNWAEAENNYREALQTFVEFNDRYSQARTHHQLGMVAQEQRNWAEAEKNYREALQIYVEVNDRYSRASTYHHLGMVAQGQRNWAEAEKNYRETVRIFVEFNDRYSQAITYHQLGIVAQEQHNWAEAENNYREALRIYVEFNDRYSQARTYHNLGALAQEHLNWAEAENNYREALRICVEFNDRYSRAKTYHQMGMVAQAQYNWPDAEKHYREALQIEIEFNDRYSQASTYHQLGRVAQQQRNWAEAEKNYRDALQICVEFNDRHSQASTFAALGLTARENGRLEEAAANLLQALEIFLEYRDLYRAELPLQVLHEVEHDVPGLAERVAAVMRKFGPSDS